MLDPSADEIRDWGNSVSELVADYLGGLRDRRVYRQMSSREIRERLDTTLPTKGIDFDGLLKVFRETIIPFSRQRTAPTLHKNHPAKKRLTGRGGAKTNRVPEVPR
jgi:hypothetical protein